MEARKVEKRWLEVQRRSKVVRQADGSQKTIDLAHWYGRMKIDGHWKWFKLFTDQRASQQRWNEMVRDRELRDAGVIVPQMDAAKLPLSQHVSEYLADLKRTASDAHYRIAKYMLKKFIELAGWNSLADINEQGASRVLSGVQSSGSTVAYANQYLSRIKAFVNWCIPERLPTNPLAKLKRGNAKKALKRRARRPLAEHELAKLLASCPAERRLKYAFPAFTGLRRKELGEVRWGDLHLDSVIPYIQLRPEQTKTGETIALPLHPYLVAELQTLTPGMPASNLFSFLPEGRTMLRDLTIAGVKQADANGRRADYHGLRHTFATRLDASGCSHATRRALMRHGSGDQTDGYTLARLSEMYQAIKRLPWPNRGEAVAIPKTGTDSVDMEWTRPALAPAVIGGQPAVQSPLPVCDISRKHQAFTNDRQGLAPSDLIWPPNRDSVLEIRPRSSVG